MSRIANGNFYLKKFFGNLYVIRDSFTANVINFNEGGRVLWWKNSTLSQNSWVLDKKLPITAAWLKQVTNLFGPQFLLHPMRILNYVF